MAMQMKRAMPPVELMDDRLTLTSGRCMYCSEEIAGYVVEEYCDWCGKYHKTHVETYCEDCRKGFILEPSPAASYCDEGGS